MDHLRVEEYSRPAEYDFPFGRARVICLDYVPEKFAAWVAKHDELQGLLYMPDRQLDDDLERPGLLDQIRAGFPCLSRSCQTEDCFLGQLKETRDVLAEAREELLLIRALFEETMRLSSAEIINTMDECIRILTRDCLRRSNKVQNMFRSRFMMIKYLIEEQAEEFFGKITGAYEHEDCQTKGFMGFVKIDDLLDSSEDCLQTVVKCVTENLKSYKDRMDTINSVRDRLEQGDVLQGEWAGVRVVIDAMQLIEQGLSQFGRSVLACGPMLDLDSLQAGASVAIVMELEREKKALNTRILRHIRETKSAQLQMTLEKMDRDEAMIRIKSEVHEIAREKLRLAETAPQPTKKVVSKRTRRKKRQEAEKAKDQKLEGLYEYRSLPKERRHTTPAAFDRDETETRDLWLGLDTASKTSVVPATASKTSGLPATASTTPGVPEDKPESKAADDATHEMGPKRRKAPPRETKVQRELRLALEALESGPKLSKKIESKKQKKYRLAEEEKRRQKLEKEAEVEEQLWLALREEESIPEEDVAAQEEDVGALEEDMAALEEDLAIVEEQLEEAAEVDWREVREAARHPRRHTVPRYPLPPRVGPSWGEEDEEEQPEALVHAATMTYGVLLDFQYEWQRSDWACGLELGEIRGHAMPVRRDRSASPRWRDEFRPESRRRRRFHPQIVRDLLPPEQLTSALDEGDTFIYAIPALLDSFDKWKLDKQTCNVNVVEALDKIDLSRVKITLDKLTKPKTPKRKFTIGSFNEFQEVKQQRPRVGERDWLLQCRALRHMAMTRRENQMGLRNIGNSFGALLNKAVLGYQEIPDQKPIGVHKVTFSKGRPINSAD